MEIGVFIPIGNNGWLISKNAPQYMPSFDLNREVVQKAEGYGFDFALSMIKLRGFGGETRFWDYNLESFTLMSALAAVTTRIKLFATTAVLTLPPAIVARMAATIDSIAPGRFGINIVSGWAKGEYDQMGLWPGDAYFGYRYDYSEEYVQVLKDLWQDGKSDFQGKYFQMSDCKLGPQPQGKIEIVGAGQSDRGMDFVANYGDYNFVTCGGINQPRQHAPVVEKLVEASRKSGRDVGAYILCMVIMGETDEEAMAKWEHYKAGADMGALAWMADQGSKDTTSDSNSTARHINLPEGAINFNIGTFIGSHATVARLLDEAASIPGTKGIMLTFDDFLQGLDEFAERVQPLMECRAHIVSENA
ncbi:pyrimidine utilization protein A [Novosphingobium olei]|uniref:Pyrimidine monooxygenase RutA n=1 Tax=Novosphingobium olei TaxID=2728851 RepID=A0A7Y0G9C5_9SPHN|nr:pyrimidine utilization protein A [Novosphingobium olei]NML92888.1 pyrimidine utilization protein A [Novosphingobium olei]